ncbi:hypothetical protein ONZ45_g13392 [Pleurotus djamor]|nr:hypothetical protein ONZ45_g13392 [Pleurotus djamor]
MTTAPQAQEMAHLPHEWEYRYVKEAEKFRNFLLLFWGAAGREGRDNFLNAVFLILFNRFPVVNPPEDYRDSAKLLKGILNAHRSNS